MKGCKNFAMHTVDFTKMVAAGNDFVVINNVSGNCKFREPVLPGLAKKICDRKYGAGADGLLFLQSSSKADIKMRIFNPDGSEADMCGNGARCCAAFFEYDISSVRAKVIKIDTKAGIIESFVSGDMVRLKMPDPRNMSLGPKINFINTGVPHAVIFVDDLENTDVDNMGRQIRNSKEFAPQGTNVNFVKVIDKDTIAARTYERGVEAETLACGTGSVASAIISGVHNVITRSGEILKVYFDKKDGKISNVCLEGSAKIVYTGRFSYDI